MAQRLLNDCFLHGNERIAHAEALTALSARIVPIAGEEVIALWAAAGRVLARAIDAPHPVPNHTNAAVDGYAFAAADYDRQKGATLAVSGRVAAGRAFGGPVQPRTAIRIFTGAVLPAGLDSVAMQEDCSADASSVALPAGLKPGLNVRKAGEDVATGQRLYEAGHVLRPQDLAAIASIGMGEVVCHRRLKVGIVSSGDEVVRAGPGPLEHGKVFDEDRTDQVAEFETVEEWTIKNSSTGDHPFHMHVFPFQVTAVNGVPVEFQGYRDTVNVPPNGSLTVRIRFNDFIGRVVYHCHLPSHSDLGMMGILRVEER